MKEFRIPFIRLVSSADSVRGFMLGLCSLGMIREMHRRGIRAGYPDRTLGLGRQGSLSKELILKELKKRGSGTVELIVHPSLGDNEYHRHWKYAGENETTGLLSEEVGELLQNRRMAAVAVPATGNWAAAESAAHIPPKRPINSVSVVVPTYREAENIPVLVRRIKTMAEEHGLNVEMLIVDDGSGDGTREVVGALGEDHWAKLVVREGKRSLSQAVVDGLQMVQNELLLVMDADLSHPPEMIPRLLEELADPDVDFVFGSRYVEGGTIDEGWTFFRRVNSLVARLLARPLTPVRDPMSGFFALRRATFLAADELNPMGFKIGLELIVKCHCKNVREVPIHFNPRLYGASNLGVRERIQYLQQLKRLMVYRLRKSEFSKTK